MKYLERVGVRIERHSSRGMTFGLLMILRSIDIIGNERALGKVRAMTAPDCASIVRAATHIGSDRRAYFTLGLCVISFDNSISRV